MKMKKRTTSATILLLIVAVLVAGCSEEKKKERQPVSVSVQKVVETGDLEVFAYSGTIEESKSTPLSFPVVGTVTKVYVSEGDFVSRGQVIAELNSESYQLAYEMALATLKQAEDAMKRLEPMYRNGNLPEIKYIEAQTGLMQAKSATALAKKNITDSRLISPVSGYVGTRSIDPGMTAMPNLTSITIVEISKVFAKVPVPENEISKVKKGLKAKVRVSALEDEEFTGSVEEIGVMADYLAHTYKVKIGLVNKNKDLKPGMVCSVVLEDGTSRTGFIIPANAISTDAQQKTFVFVAQNGRAVKRYIETGALRKNGIEVTGGLTSNDMIIISGLSRLADGMAIKVVNGNTTTTGDK